MSSEYQSFVKTLRAGNKPEFSSTSKSVEYARDLDAQDKLSSLRDNFIIPTKGSLRKRALNGTVPGKSEFPEECSNRISTNLIRDNPSKNTKWHLK